MIILSNICISFGGREVLQNVDLNLREGECIAVVGPNGCGKSTLLRVIAGLEHPERGNVSLPSHATLGYLPQEANLDIDHSLEEELLTAFTEVEAALAQMTQLEDLMGSLDHTSPEYARTLNQYTDCQHIVDHHEGYTRHAQLQRVAEGLGFAPRDLQRSCREFSGGWQMRILLAKLLMRKPEIMLLDEPTNHLDLESTLWLEDYIKTCGRTVVLVSHERATMDRLAQRVVCLEWGQAEVYTGSYSKFVVQNDIKRQAQWEAYDRQQEEIRAMESFIRRFRCNSSKAPLVQSRIKQLEKIERISPPFHPNAIHFNFPPAPRSWQDVVVLKDLGHAYGAHRILSGLNLIIQRGEKIGLVGVNGAGKSTLLRLMAGRETPTEGECRLGGNVTRAYFAQYDTATLTSSQNLLGAIEASAPPGEAQRARDLLGAFLFTGDEVEKPLRALSGGERTRFRLAQMLFSPANLLLLDEPTNHLDITSRATVEEALKSYQGTVVVVSHDRVFMDRVVTKIVELDGGVMRVFPGTYSEYVAYKDLLFAHHEPNFDQSAARPAETAPLVLDKEQRQRQREARKDRERRQRTMEREISGVETRISQLEQRLRELDQLLADPEVATDYARLAPLTEERRQAQQSHQELLVEWERLHEELSV